MMQLFLDALRFSKSGSPQYVMQKGLDLFRTGDECSMAKFRSDGYQLKAKAVNGTLEQDWRLNLTSMQEDIRAVALTELLGLKERYSIICIHTQEFFDELYRHEAIRMYATVWRHMCGSHPEVIHVTVLDRANQPEEFKKGQEKAQQILALLSHFPHDYSSAKLTDAEVEQLWDELEDVPCYEDEKCELCLDVDWQGWPRGTDRDTIWHWFDQHHSKGVGWLMNEYENNL